jgi:hypothetical protein
MTYAGNALMGLVDLAVTVALTAGFGGDAAAKHRSHDVINAQGQTVQTASVQETARPASMRYHGGPKSPMWSGQ